LGVRAKPGQRRSHFVRGDGRELPLAGQRRPEAGEQPIDRIDHGLEFDRRIRNSQLRQIQRMAFAKLRSVALDGAKRLVHEPPGAHEDQQERNCQEREEVAGRDAGRRLAVALTLGDLDDHARFLGRVRVGADLFAIDDGFAETAFCNRLHRPALLRLVALMHQPSFDGPDLVVIARVQRAFGLLDDVAQSFDETFFLDLVFRECEHRARERDQPRVQHVPVGDLVGPVHGDAARQQRRGAYEKRDGRDPMTQGPRRHEAMHSASRDRADSRRRAP
jgi:hypothetical protein